MKGHTSNYPYEPRAGLNPFEEELKSSAETLQYVAAEQSKLARLLAYFAPFEAVTSDDVRSISVSGACLTFNLDVPDSRFVHALAQFTGLTFEKTRSYDGQSLRLKSKLLPPEHPLALLDITTVMVADYLPQSCKVVVDHHKPLEKAERIVYERLLAEGRPVYKTVCDGVEATDEAAQAPIPLEAVEVPF